MTCPDHLAVGRIVFWQRIPSFHQLPLFEALAGMGVEVHFVGNLQHQVDSHSHDLRSVSGLHCHVAPSGSSEAIRLLDSLHRTDAGAISIFSNPHDDALYKQLWRHCATTDKHFAFYQAAPGAYSGKLGMLARKIWYALKAPHISRRIVCILCNGTICRNFLLAAGFKAEILIDWGYFTSDPLALLHEKREKNASNSALDRDSLSFIYVGRLVPHKRVDLPIQAVAKLKERGIACSLTIIGDGPSRQELLALAGSCGASEQISFLGQQPRTAIQGIMREHGCLVLPSDQEEWGAVINEAIASGIPVICSGSCGARDLLGGGAGLIFAPGSLDGLVQCMARIASDSSSRRSMREAAMETARTCSPGTAAGYLMRSLDLRLRGLAAEKAPWLATPGHSLQPQNGPPTCR